MGTLAYGRSDDLLLYKEILVLRFYLNSLLAPDSPAQAIQNQFARLTLLTEAGKMAQAGENAGIMDIKRT